MQNEELELKRLGPQNFAVEQVCSMSQGCARALAGPAVWGSG